jgi:hypothetical protein
MTEASSSAPTELTSFILAEVQRQTSEDALRKLVEKKIGESVASAVESSFRSYGDLRKQIEKAVNNSLQIGPNMDIPSFGVMVLSLLRQKLDERVNGLISDRLDAEMNEILSIAPKELKLSDLVEAIVKKASEDLSDRYGTSVTCIVEQNERYPDWYDIYLDEEEDKPKRDCEIQISLISDGKIHSIKIDGKDPKTTIRMGAMWGYQKMIFGAYCCGSKFIVDTEYPSTGIGDY